MPTSPYSGLADSEVVASTFELDLVARASTDIVTTTTADPSTGGTSLAVTDRTFGDKYSVTSGDFYIDVVGTSGVSERMKVTAGHGAGSGSFTVVRARQGTTAVAHSVGAKVAVVVRVPREEPIDATKQVSFRGRTGTWRIPGRAGAVGQKIFALHNATGSPTNVDISKITVDMVQTAAHALASLPAVVKAYRFTAIPTGGTVLTKNGEDTGLVSKVAVTAWNDASGDGTLSGTALTIGAITVGAQTGMLAEAVAPRLITGAGFEMFDTIIFFDGEDETITLRPLEGICIFLDYTTGLNPATNFWTVSARWTEWTTA